MISKKFAFVATTALVGSLMAASGAYAQSTGTTEVEQVTVTAAGTKDLSGVITAETAPKTKASVDQEFISEQAAGQTIIQTLNLTPGLNFTNSDPYGSSGGNLRMRGFDGARISLTFDGVPLNDTGNYAIYTNQQIDPELIYRATVNQGTTDVDSPTASATGGTINYVVRKPSNDMGFMADISRGSFNYGRVFGMFDTGAFGPTDASAFVSASYQKYDKFKGPGELEKKQFNGRLYQPIGDNGDFISVAFHYNENRNNFYWNPTMAQYKATPNIEEDRGCLRPTPVNGTVQNDNTQSVFTRYDGTTGVGSCTNYYNLRINPSNTGNIRFQSKFHLADNLVLTVDPSFQYVLANGGGFTTVSEKDDRLDGGPAGTGVDLNGDGDTLDTVALYSPNTTNTRRYGVLSSLIWTINDNNRLRFAYTYDYGRHRQTGDYGYLSLTGNPQDVFGGKDGYGRRILSTDGFSLRGRDRFSFAILNQVSLEYVGKFMDDALTVNIGVRAPFFKRDLNQYCYSQNGSSNVRCTSETPTATLANGNVQFASTGATQYIPPYSITKKYDDVLPNVGVSYKFADHQSVYLSYAEGLSAPRTDNLYTPLRVGTAIVLPGADPETTKSWDLGYRYSSPTVIGNVALWKTSFENYIVSSFDDTLGIFVDRNVGNVDLWGVDAQVGWQPADNWTLYGSLSYAHGELASDIPLSATTFLPTKGKMLVETPEWQAAFRVDWDATDALHFGFQGKHVGDRYSTDVNDEQTPAYNIFDVDARYDLPWGNGTYLQLNVTNLFDEDYLGNISSRNNAKTVDVLPGPGVSNRAGSAPTYSVGAPRTVQVTLSTKF